VLDCEGLGVGSDENMRVSITLYSFQGRGDEPSPSSPEFIVRLVLCPSLGRRADPAGKPVRGAALAQVLHEGQVLPCEGPGFGAFHVPLRSGVDAFPATRQVAPGPQAEAACVRMGSVELRAVAVEDSAALLGTTVAPVCR
jgi:hypothetical protein